MNVLTMSAAAAVLLASAGGASAAWQRDAYGWTVPAPVVVQTGPVHRRLDYGTGHDGHATLSGGPVGGYADRR